jgi:branched-chain amino acid transport system ATP-binding protein
MPLLKTINLTAFYGDFQALFGITTELREGETIAIIGANGAGKSTYLKAIVGLLPRDPESVVFDGRPIGALGPANIKKLGIALVPEGRRLFPSLSVLENLLIGSYGSKTGPWSVDAIFEIFPARAEHRHRSSTMLSGGQQQMVAIGRALMSNPRLLLCDELSLGLAPIVIQDLYRALARVKASGTSLILIEQDIVQATRVADRIYCFQEGRVSLNGRPAELNRDQIHLAYFGSGR